MFKIFTITAVLFISTISNAQYCIPTLRFLENPPEYEFDEEIEPVEYDSNVAEPVSIAAIIAIAAAKELGKNIGMKAFNEIFGPNGSPRKGLTEGDFKRIRSIVNEELRKDAERKMSECVISIQKHAGFINASWNADTARGLVTSMTTIISNMQAFPHRQSRIGMIPSAMLLGTMQLAIQQERVRRGEDTVDGFNFLRDELITFRNVAHEKTIDPMFDWDDTNLFHLENYFERYSTGSKGDKKYIWLVKGKIWGKIHFVKARPWYNPCDISEYQECLKNYKQELKNEKFGRFLFQAGIWKDLAGGSTVDPVTYKKGSALDIWADGIKRISVK